MDTPSTQTRLHVAATMGRAKICRDLIAAGADPNARDGYGDPPLVHALLSFALMSRGGIDFSANSRTKAQFEADLAEVVCVLLDAGTPISAPMESEINPLDPNTRAWFDGICANRLAAQLNANTAPAPAAPTPPGRL